jgi:hypothetical protein
LEVGPWKSERPQILEWLSGLKQVKKSEQYWFNKGDILTSSPSEVAQTLLDSFSIAAQPQLFKTVEERQAFDSQFHASILVSMTAKTLLEEVVSKGMSNGHPLMLQFLACPPNVSFSLHSHASVELDIPLVGKLWEKYLYGAALNPTLLLRKSPLTVVQEMDQEGSKLYTPLFDKEVKEVTQSLTQTVVDKIPSLGNIGKFVDRVNEEGSVIYNEIGSIHQTYTKDQGCLILALWCGAHANIDQLKCCCTGIEGSKGLFLP